MRPHATGTGGGGVGRRKAGAAAAAASREWMVVPASGSARVEEAGKHAVMARTGLPARDLRVLDPLLSYPSTILGRERAIVVNLERVKAVITAAEVLLPNSKDPAFARFVRDLQTRVLASSSDQAADLTDMEGESSAVASPFPVPNSSKGHELEMTKKSTTVVPEMTSSTSMPNLAAAKDGNAKVLPFEFRALEVCLESACRSLEEETSTLEQEAYPALDELTSKISTLNLERVRQIKSRLVAISGRVQKISLLNKKSVRLHLELRLMIHLRLRRTGMKIIEVSQMEAMVALLVISLTLKNWRCFLRHTLCRLMAHLTSCRI
ncbi:hypothetical protein PVAP13_5NG012577 [Panicum virgatum]|uniref:Magnesium transporter n=1 Tax=Panicum virgatum TaxID=38727 RepID=A0A8T0S669_PANVG|nr:hypothetical protein PVAP13_5NG012577 [Panicum virgatum]